MADDNQRWAVYHRTEGWLEDTCAGGVFSFSVGQAKWFSLPKEAVDELVAADMLTLAEAAALASTANAKFFVLGVR